MHELSIVKNLVKTVLSRYTPAENEKIISVNVVMGEMHDYEEEWLTKYFVQMTAGTVLDGAMLKVERLPVKLRCRNCGAEFGNSKEEEAVLLACKKCGSYDIEIVNGREFYIKELEVEA
ncbi:MAG: hydrogenase maturation nickel metallochaperone HypA [Lachnospiraceae bacterium]|nr:hydrogenase maturation nickel metallochaperone HypA [Lachnospiraceae bacterium]